MTGLQSMKIYLNGKLVPERSAKVSVFDHGLLYGDGVFEGIRAYNGRVFKLEDHVDRLFKSAKAICLEMPLTQAAICNAVVRTCKANAIKDGYIRLVVTRGVGTLGLNPYLCKKPQVIIIAAGIQMYPKKMYRDGLEVVTLGTMRNVSEAVNPRIKSLNYLNNVLAKIEAINAGVPEGIMLSPNGHVAEATGENIFAVRDGVLITPPSWCGALEGITREVVMELATDAGYEVRQDVLSRYDLYVAEEVFLTGTAAEIIGVVKVDRRIIGDGLPGPITRKLSKAFSKFAKAQGREIK